MPPEEQPQNNPQPALEPEQPLAQNPQPVSDTTTTQQPYGAKAGRIVAWVLAIFLVVGGLVGGFFVGFMVAFGACFKSSCSPIEGGAPFWIPVATLFITIPLAKRITKKRD